MIAPVTPNAAFARVDQGVDYYQRQPYLAVGPGRVYAVTGGFSGGTGKAVYYQLDTPVTVNGRTYNQLYVAETTPLVKVGQRVKAGTPLATGGSAELGFANGRTPYAPLVGGLGADTRPTQPGQDFLDFAKSPGEDVAPATAHPAVTLPEPPQAAGSSVPAGPPPPESTLPLILPPGTNPQGLWQQITSQPNLSPDTLSYAGNVSLTG